MFHFEVVAKGRGMVTKGRGMVAKGRGMVAKEENTRKLILHQNQIVSFSSSTFHSRYSVAGI